MASNKPPQQHYGLGSSKGCRNMLNHVLEYSTRHDWHLFPIFYIKRTGQCSCNNKDCDRAGKHPIPKNGCQAATADGALLRQMWKANPHANIGMATGHNGIVVVDVDSAGNKKGDASLAQLELDHGALPATLATRTGSGGRHYFFHTTTPIKNSTSKVAKDIDIRGIGGYVILPPSNHKSGNKYEWLNDLPIAEMPPWLENLCLPVIAHDTLQQEVLNDTNKLTFQQAEQLLNYIDADCDRDTWWKVGAALKYEFGDQDGFKLWDSWSARAPNKYDSKIMRPQWNSFQFHGITAGTLVHFAKTNGGFRGFDVEAADANMFVDDWCYVASIKRFVNTQTFTEWDKEQFDAMFAVHFNKGKAGDHVLHNPQFRRVDGATYAPQQERWIDEGNQSKLNYWRPSNVVASAGSVEIFKKHIDYLFPSKEESQILIQYLAYQVQHPGIKVHWALMLEGDPGTGKSYFGLVMRACLGDHNVRMVHNEQLHEAFTGWLRNTQLIVVEEMMARQRLELMNKLKPLITEPWIMIREMYRPPYEQPNRSNFLFFSNHKDSLILDASDRRYCILKTTQPPHPSGPAYYKKLFDWTNNNSAAILYYLKHTVNLQSFQPTAHAPLTKGKLDLITASMAPLDLFLWEQTERKEYPMHWDILSPTDLIKPLMDYNLRATTKEIGNAFHRLGFKPLGRTRIGPRDADQKTFFWAIRNFDRYSSMDIVTVKRSWQQQHTDGGDALADTLYNQRTKNHIIEQEAM